MQTATTGATEALASDAGGARVAAEATQTQRVHNPATDVSSARREPLPTRGRPGGYSSRAITGAPRMS